MEYKIENDIIMTAHIEKKGIGTEVQKRVRRLLLKTNIVSHEPFMFTSRKQILHLALVSVRWEMV